MVKSLNELSNELKVFIIEAQSDAHNSSGIQANRYNNLKLSMEIAKDPTPHVIVNICMSEAVFNIKNYEKIAGSLGPEERYVQKWFGKASTMENLQEAWQARVKSRGKATGDELD